MRHYILLGVFVAMAGVSAQSYADSNPLPMNRITMNLVQEQWATTDTAKVIVNVAAVLDKAGLAKTHQQINNNLKKISKNAAWHITQFNRMKDPSGLEKLTIRAEARISEGELSGLRDRAKGVSRPGEKYTIAAISFKPSLADVQKTREQVRNKIYRQANNELSRINKIYGNQQYFLHSVNFIPGFRPQPMQKQRMMMSAAVSADAGVSVSDKVTVNATVIFASKNK